MTTNSVSPDMSEIPIPNPGSDAALDAGCLCPVLDNHHGKGFSWGEGGPKFWISGDCPLHARPKEDK